MNKGWYKPANFPLVVLGWPVSWQILIQQAFWNFKFLSGCILRSAWSELAFLLRVARTEGPSWLACKLANSYTGKRFGIASFCLDVS